MNISDIGRQLASQRRIVKGVCPICGEPFEGTTKRKYCTKTRCRVRAFRQRQRAKAQEDPK